MKIFGAWLIALGIISLMVGFVGLRINLLFLLDEFGPVIGYILKAGLIVVGIWIWRKDDLAVEDEDVSSDGNSKAWVPVAIGGALVVSVVAVIVVSEFKKRRVDSLISRPLAAATWAGKSTGEWPCLVLLQRAQFKSHSTMEAGCASLVRLPTGEIAALTAGHLLGKDGGVKPGFLQSGLGGLAPAKLKTLETEISSWQLYLPDDTNVIASVTGLYGTADKFKEDCDQVLLRVFPGKDGFPAPPLGVRTEPVVMDESVFVVTVGFDDDGSIRQEVHKAKRIPGLGFTCAFDGPPVDLNGNSGAPVLDKNGHLVAIVTGGTLMDLANNSALAHSFSGHAITELLPVLRTAVAEKGVVENPAEVKAVVRMPKAKVKSQDEKQPLSRVTTSA